MLHQVSFTARNPKRVAGVLANLIGGRVTKSESLDGGYIAWVPDTVGTAIKIYPHGTELVPAPGNDQASFQHNYFASKQSSTHAAVSVTRTESEVLAAAARQGWKAVKQDRGEFEVIEMWVEGTVMLEILTPEMLSEYLSTVKSPHIAASGETVEPLVFKVDVNTDPATIFRAWTSAKALREWWPVAEAQIDLRIGGRYEIFFLPDDLARRSDRTNRIPDSLRGHPASKQGTRGSEHCRILSYNPEKMLSFTWNSPSHVGLRDAQTWVVLEFEATDTGTAVSLTHCGFRQGEEWDQCRDYFQQAWHRLLRRLVSHWNRGVDLRTPRAQTRTTSVAPPAQRQPGPASGQLDPVCGIEISSASPLATTR